MLSILGIGLVSPAGSCARDHVFFPRAEAPAPWPSPFVLPDGRTEWIGSCPWIRPTSDVAARMLALGRGALEEALSPLPRDARQDLPLFLSTPTPRPGLTHEALGGLANELKRSLPFSSVELVPGAAGAFAALGQMEQFFASRRIGAAAVVGVDSFFSVEALSDWVTRPTNPWLQRTVPPAEGAGALLVAAPEQAVRWGLTPLGSFIESRHAVGRSNDENDEVVDGFAMTALLQSLPLSAPIRSVFGQAGVDLLRSREWEWAVARLGERFDPSYFGVCLEEAVGGVGAAAGVMNLAYSMAAFRHGAAPSEARSPVSLLAWAISRDGTRGITLGSPSAVRAPEPGEVKGIAVLSVLADTARARRVLREPFVAPERAPRVGRNGAPEDEVDEDDEPWEEQTEEIESEATPTIAPMLPELPHELCPLPPVRCGRERTSTLPEFYAAVVAHCAERAAALLRRRVEVPWRRVAAHEMRLLRQVDAIVAAGPLALVDSVAWWKRELDRSWSSLAGALAVLAFEGDDALEAIAHVVHLLPHDAEAHAAAIAEALALSEHPGLPALARGLAGSPHPIARAIGIRSLATRATLTLPALHEALEDTEPPVLCAAIRACERLPSAARGPFVSALRERCGRWEPAVAFAAARLLTVWGDREVGRDAAFGVLNPRLGPLALEMFVLVGEAGDAPKLELLLARLPITRQCLSIVARFGSPAAAPHLLHYLTDESLCEAAAALVTLFGPLVAQAEVHNPGAWHAALVHRPFDPKLRYRRGSPWTPAVVVDECESGELGRVELELRIDELCARVGIPHFVDVAPWWPSAQANVSTFLTLARRRGMSLRGRTT